MAARRLKPGLCLDNLRF